MVGSVELYGGVLGYMVGCWVTWWGVGLHGWEWGVTWWSVGLHDGSVGLHDGVLGYMVRSGELHGGVLGYIVVVIVGIIIICLSLIC